MDEPDWQRRTGRRRRQARLAIALAVLAVTGISVYYWGKPTSGYYSSSAGGEALNTTTPTAVPDVAPIDLSRPFDQTPAQSWAEGIAGVTFPPASKVGAFTAGQVGAALDLLKRAITVAQLDPATLEGHRPDEYLALLAPYAQANVRGHEAVYLTYLADGYHLLPVPPRTSGTVTVRAGRAGELVMHADYVVAYAFDPGGQRVSSPGDLDAFVRIGVDYAYRTGSGWQVDSRGLGVDDIRPYLTGIACHAAKNGFLAPAVSEPEFDGRSLAPEPGRFDPTQPMPTEENCG